MLKLHNNIKNCVNICSTCATRRLAVSVFVQYLQKILHTTKPKTGTNVIKRLNNLKFGLKQAVWFKPFNVWVCVWDLITSGPDCLLYVHFSKHFGGISERFGVCRSIHCSLSSAFTACLLLNNVSLFILIDLKNQITKPQYAVKSNYFLINV